MNAAEMRDTFNTYRRSVYGWAYRVVGNHHDALDVTQDVFVKWWQAHRKDAAPIHAVGWLRRVTINHSINLCKARARQLPAAHLEPSRDRQGAGAPEWDDAERREIARVAADAMNEMSEQQRSVLFAKVYDGYTFAQVAEQMDLAVPTVKTHYLRALRAARRKFTEAGIIAGDQP